MIRRIVPVILFLSFSYFIYYYAYQGLSVVVSSFAPTVQNIFQITYWVFFSLVIFLMLAGVLGRIAGRHSNLAFKVGIHVYVMFLVSQVIFDVVLFAEDIYRVTYASIGAMTDSSIDHISRSPVISAMGTVLAAIPMISFVYGMMKGKYKYTVHRHTIYLDNLPDAFENFTITQISDIHAGSLDDPKAVQRGIDLINEQQSDLFVFTGDLVNNQATEIEPWINHFKQITAREGKYAILGNHDYGDYIAWNSIDDKENNLLRLKSFHQEMGFHLLLDEHVNITRNGESIKLLGVENWGVGFGKRGNLTKALLGTDAGDFKILLSHDPSHWNAEIKDHPSPIHLTLSGHTHGMQFGIEKFGIKWSPVKYRYRHWAGLLEENNRFLYVNRGFGFLGFSGRVGIWPEITVLVLRKKVTNDRKYLTS